MKYFIDTEFLEGVQERPLMLRGRLGNLMIGYPKPTIDLISIGIVAEDGREYYAISKDFNLNDAWNRFDLKSMTNLRGDSDTNKMKVYWLRDNVIYPIFWHLYQKSYPAKSEEEYGNLGNFMGWKERKGTGMKEFKKLLQEYGKTNKQIAEEIKKFTSFPHWMIGEDNLRVKVNPEFYAYYADYDWVVFCWLFGKMIDLPSGFPMYCKDLKQIFDEKQNQIDLNTSVTEPRKDIKSHKDYPQQDSSKSHNAIEDARWNKQLYEFFKKL